MGWSGSGKTTLLVAVLPLLRAAGLRVSTIKHAHHGLDLDKPGKDSFRHRMAGAEEVLVVGGQRWALLRETPVAVAPVRDPPAGEGATGEGLAREEASQDRENMPDLAALASRLAPVDLVLVEGFKSSGMAQIEVHRSSLGKQPLWPASSAILAVAADTRLAGAPALLGSQCLLPLNDPPVVASWIAEFVRRPDRGG